LGPDTELQDHMRGNFTDRERSAKIMKLLQDVLKKCWRMLLEAVQANLEKMQEQCAQEMKIVLKAELQSGAPGVGHFNLPTRSHVASLIPVRDASYDGASARDISITLRNGYVQNLNNLHLKFDGLHYVL